MASQQAPRRMRQSEDARATRQPLRDPTEQLSSLVSAHRSRAVKSPIGRNDPVATPDGAERSRGRRQRPLPPLPDAGPSEPAERSRKNKQRPLVLVAATQSHNAVENNNRREQEHQSRRNHSRSRDSQGNTGSQDQPASVSAPDNSNSFITSELILVKIELVDLKQKVSGYKSTIKRQNQTILSLRRAATAHNKCIRDKDYYISKLKNQAKESEELVTTIESSLVCQICMELLVKPYALSPCGHIHCLSCLQEWFRKAPPTDDEMYDDDPEDPDYLLRRRKSCPCCRAHVKHRPAPMFVVKTITNAIMKAKGSLEASPPPDSDTDVWAGLFPDVVDEDTDEGDLDDDNDDFYDEDEDFDDEEDEEDDFEDEDEDEEFDEDYDEDDIFSYGSASDDDDAPYTGEYVAAVWEPPQVSAEDALERYALHHISPEHFAMIRRGATLGMINQFDMRYTHHSGLVAHCNHIVVFLGWNVHLSADDPNGSRFMEWVKEDIQCRAERWQLTASQTVSGLAVEARRLVPVDGLEDYDTSDTDRYD